MIDVGAAAFAFALATFAFATFALAFVFAATLLLRFALRVLAVFVLVLDPRLANAMIITTRPTPITTKAVSPPSIHQRALDFLRGGAAEGAGVQCWGAGGGGAAGLGFTAGAGR